MKKERKIESYTSSYYFTTWDSVTIKAKSKKEARLKIRSILTAKVRKFENKNFRTASFKILTFDGKIL